ncbi:hypothetical protein LCGC14_2476880, partial [marine sediment metagenome]
LMAHRKEGLVAKMRGKKGLTLGDAFPAVLTVLLVGILLVASLFLLTELSTTFTADSAAANASNDLITRFDNTIPLVGLILIIVMIAIVIGVLVSSFFVQGSGRGRGRV